MNILIEIGKHLSTYFGTNHKSVPLVWGSLLFILVGYIDYLVTLEISLSVFYLLPVSLLTWFVSKEVGFFMAILSAIAWYLTNLDSQPTASSFFVQYWNASIVLIFLITTCLLLVKLRHAQNQEKESARIDPITDVANKRLFFELARLEIKKVNRYRHPLTIVYIDIDDFKSINNTWGHCVGDKVLHTVAETLKNNIRETDILARIEGDEFVIILPGSGYEPAQIVICRVHKQLLNAMQENGWSSTFSLGAVTFINPPNSVDAMLQRVDHLMYLAKTNGKNQLKHIISV